MTNYTKSTDFAVKDTLNSGDAGKVIRGTEFETEFDDIATAIGTKADTAGPTFTGTVTIPTINLGGTTVTSTAAEINVLTGVTASTAELNLLDGVTATTAELNKLDGVTSTTDELNLVAGVTAGAVVNEKAVVYSDAGQVKATTLSIGDWIIKVDTNELVFEYDSTEVFKVGTDGAITSADNVTAFGTI
jgi:hypothetical protein